LKLIISLIANRKITQWQSLSPGVQSSSRPGTAKPIYNFAKSQSEANQPVKTVGIRNMESARQKEYFWQR
jgi:hypothetical protein